MRSLLENSWLGQLRRANKPLFYIIFAFFSLSVFSNLIRLQTTPFFIWDMYSQPHLPKPSWGYYEIRYNRGQLFHFKHTWNEPARTYVYDPLAHYLVDKEGPSSDSFRIYLESHWLKKHPAFSWILPHLTPDEAALKAFPAWFREYISRQIGQQVHDILVLDKQMAFDEKGATRPFSTDTLLIIP